MDEQMESVSSDTVPEAKPSEEEDILQISTSSKPV